jgi:methionyl aminopeptidase
LCRSFGKYEKVLPGNMSEEKRVIPSHIVKPDYWESGYPTLQLGARMIEIKQPDAIDKMRNACALARKVLNAAAKLAKVIYIVV